MKVRHASPLRKGEAVQVVDMTDTDDCVSDIMVNIAYGGSVLAVPLMQLPCAPANCGQRINPLSRTTLGMGCPPYL